MPQQNQSNPSQIPGEDVLLDTLRRSKITDEQRQQLWDAYRTPGGEPEFTGALNKLDIHDDVKQTLYDMRFKGFKNQPTNQQAPTPDAQAPKSAEPFSVGAYQARKGGPVLNINQYPSNAFAQGAERMLGVNRPPPEDLPHPYLDAISQAMQSTGKLMEATAKDPFAPFHAIVSGVSSAVADVESGIKYRDPRQVAAGTGETLGVLSATEEARRAKDVAGTLMTGRPIEGGVSADNLPGLTRENAIKLQGMGFSNQEISTMNAQELNSALAGSRKPTPAPRPTEAVPGAKASATNQASAAPATSQVSSVPTKAPEPQPQGPGGDFRGTTGPLRPYDPSGNRFAQGGTVGMEPLDLIAPKPNTNQGSPRPQVDPITGTSQLGFQRPTTTLKGPSNIPGSDPLQMALENRALFQTKPTSSYIASEKAATMSAPRPSLGPEFEAAQQSYDNERNKAILRDPKASPEDKRIAQSRLNEGITTESQPINRGTYTGVPVEPVYTKAMPGTQVPVASVDAPLPAPIEKPVTKSQPPASHELPRSVQDGLDLMMKTKKLIDEAPTDVARQAAQQRWNDLAATTKGLLKYHLQSLSPEQRQMLLDDQQAKGSRHDAQANAINDIIAGDKMSQALRAEMRGEKAMSARGQAFLVPGTATHGDIRIAIHEILGDRTATSFDEIAINQRAKAREQGLDPDAVLPEGYRRVLPEEFQTMRLAAKTELGEIQENFKNRLKDIVSDRIEKNPALMQEQGEEAAKSIHVQALKELLAEKNEKGLTLAEQIKELRDLIGRDVQRPLYAKKGAPVVSAEGVVSAPGDIPAKSLEVARRIWDKKLNKIPDDVEWVKKADEHKERGRLAKAIAQGLKSILEAKPPKGKEGEAGFIGDQGSGRASDIQVPDIQKAVQNVIKEGITAWTIGDDKPASFRGWISPDGKRFISSASKSGLMSELSDHDTLAWVALGKPQVRGGQSQKAFLENGWIRKENNGNYSVGNLKENTIDAIEMDLIRNRSISTGVFIDVWEPKGIRSIDIQQGWEDLKSSIKQELRRQRMSEVSQAGKIGGAELLTGATLGAVAGGVAGHVLGGTTGAVAGVVMGYSLGFLAPAILQSRPVIQAMKTMANVVRGAGLTLKQWFQGVPQKGMQGVDPNMDDILKEQIAHADRSVKWIERAKQLPATIYKGFDPFAYITDKKNMGMIGRVMMSFDPKGRVFRDLTIPDNQSLYMALANAGGDALGQRRYQNMSYNDIKVDANKAGLREMLDRYLNLKAYQRTNEVLQEHIQTLDSQIQNLQTKLQSPSNTVRQTVALNDDLKESQKMRKEIQDRVDQGRATPKGYTPQKIQDSLQKMQQVLGPQDYSNVEQLAQRAFQSRAHILDILFDSGIISQDAYTQYKSRGNEYIPMERIMDDLENQKFTSAASLLHLRHQTVIQTMEGSERTNVSPWEAFDHADRKAFNQLYRNDAMKSALDLAQAYPNTIGQEFSPVKADYQPKAGEMVLGHYENGQPKLFAVPKYLGETMQRVPLAMKTGLGIFANWYGHAFKKAATIGNIGFQASSLLAHAISGAILSPHGVEAKADLPVQVVKFLNDWRKAAKDVLNQGQFVRELTRYGGASGSFQAKVDPEYFANPSELGFRGKLAKGQILDAAQDLAIALENINRTNIFMRARQAGLTAKAAAWEAKQFAGMPDFSRLGDISQPLNHIFMFFNAANQYLTQAMSAIRKDPNRIFGLMATMTAMSIALSAWNMQQVDSKGNNLLRKETTFDRQRNWIVELPWTYYTHAGAEKGYTVKIPKPFIVRLLNPVEDVINYGMGKEARTGQQQALDSIANVSPIHLNLKADDLAKSAIQSGVSALHPLAKFGIQQFSNTDDYGRPIVPGSQQGIASQYQEGPYTSSVAQRMGKGGVQGAVAGGALGAMLGGMTGLPGAVVGGGVGAVAGASGISPRRIDVGVRSLTAGAGAQAESILDPFFGGTESKHQLSGMERFRQAPLLGPIISRFTTSPSDAEFETLSSRYYTILQRAQTIKQTADMLLKQGKAEESARYAQAHQSELFKAMALFQLDKVIKNANEMVRQLQASPEADTPSGKEAIQAAYEARTQLLRQAKTLMDSAETKASDTGPMANPVSNSGSNK